MRRWDIIGRGIGKGVGWFRCSPSCVEKGFPFHARRHARGTTKISETRSHMEMEGHPCRPSKWFNESRQAWDWIWLWRLCCRQRTVVTCRTRDIEGKCQRWREGEEKGEFSSSANLPKLSWNVPPYDVASSRETVIESHVSYFSRV